MRDRRLDLWRGLCLIDMILVHLAHEGVQFGVLTPWIVDYTRFAAGGFVFVAGLGVGLVLSQSRDHSAATPRRTPSAVLWPRALYLLGVHYALTGVIVTLDVLRGARPPAADPLALVRDVVLLREAPPYIDVLPLYVVMLLVTPAAFALLRRGLWPLVAIVSAALFAYGQQQPGALSPAASVEFPFLLWQTFFVAGLLFSAVVPRLDRSRRAWRAAMGAAWVAFVATSTLAYAPRFDLFPAPTFVSFVKVPLTAGELCRYLAATLVVLTTSAVVWRRLHDSTSAAAIAALGRRSLVVYGAHVFVQMLVIVAVTPLWWIGSAQALVVIPVLASLWALAQGVDRWEARPRAWPAVRQALRRWGAIPAGIATAAALIALARPTLVVDSGAPPAVEQIADVARETPDGDLDDTPGVEFVDALEEPGVSGPDAAPREDPPSLDAGEDAAIQSGIATPAYV